MVPWILIKSALTHKNKVLESWGQPQPNFHIQWSIYSIYPTVFTFTFCTCCYAAVNELWMQQCVQITVRLLYERRHTEWFYFRSNIYAVLAVSLWACVGAMALSTNYMYIVLTSDYIHVCYVLGNFCCPHVFKKIGGWKLKNAKWSECKQSTFLTF